MRKLLLACVMLAWLTVAAWGQTATSFSTTASTVGSTVITLQGAVPSGNSISYQINGSGCTGCTVPMHGAITSFNGDNGTLVYTPTSGYIGTDSFTFTVTATPTGGGAGTISSAGTVTITVTNAKTAISGLLTNQDGTPRVGTITFFMVQQASSGDSIVPGSSSVSSVLNGAGRYSVSVFPSRNLSPQAYYNVKFKDRLTNKTDDLGVYDIPASGVTIDLASCACKVTDANLAARYTFLSAAAYNFALAPSQKITVSNNGTAVGQQPEINFIASSPLEQTITNNSGSNRIDVTFSCSTCTGGGGGGSGTVSGTLNKYAVFSGSSAVGDGLLSQSGTTVSLPGHLAITQQSNSTTPLSVQASASPTVPLARFLDSGSTERFAVGADAALQFSGFTTLPSGAASNQAKLAYYTGTGSFAQQLVLSRNGSSQWGPVVRVSPTALVTSNYVPLWNAVGDIGNSIISQTGVGTIAVGGNVEATALGYKASSNSGFTRLRATNSYDTPSGIYNIQMAVLESELGLTNGLAINTKESGAPIIFGVYDTERARVTSTGVTITSNAANTSGLKFTNLTSASPAGASTAYLGLDSSGNVVVAAAPSGGGGGGGAPTDATYLVYSLNSTLTNERRLLHESGLAEADGGINGDLVVTLDTAYAPTWTAPHTFNPGTSPTTAALFDIAALGSTGTRNSHSIVQRARARDGSGSYSLDWQTNVEAYETGGGNRWRLQSRRGGNAYGTRLAIEENGDARVYGALSAGSSTIALTDSTGYLQLTAFAAGARTGNGAKVVTGTGSYTSGNCLSIDASGNAVDSGSACGSGGGGSSAWNSVTSPSGNQALTMAAYSSTWTWNSATSTTNLFKLTDTANNTGTGVLATFATGSASTLKPFSVEPRGLRSIYADHLGNVVAGVASRSTTDTDGFLYVPGVNGLNVNSPTGHSSFVPLYVDTNAGVLRAFYSSNWHALGADDGDKGDFTISSGVYTVDNGAISNAKLASVSTATFKGRTSSGTGNVEDLTATQATALLNAFTGDSGAGGVKGLVPAPASGDAAASKFLKADGTWATVSAGSSGITTGTTTITSGTNTRVLYNNSGVVGEYSITGTGNVVMSASPTLSGTAALSNASLSGSLNFNSDTYLTRDAANTLVQRNGANAQAFRVYNTYTDASNYERGYFRFNSNVLEIGFESSGTGISSRSVLLQSSSGILSLNGGGGLSLNSGGTARFTISGSGFLAATDNTLDIGASGANRPRDIYNRYIRPAGLWFKNGATDTTYIDSTTNGVLLVTNAAATDFDRLQFGGTTASFPALKRSTTTLQVRLADDSGFAAIQSLYIRFGSGSPEGVVTAPVGAIYSRTDGGANTTLYVKESGTGNTGWVAK